MRFALLNCGIQSQLAAKYLVEKYDFESFSIYKLLEDTKNQYFKQINYNNFIDLLKLSYEKLDKYSLVNYIIRKSDKIKNVVIPDISNITEYYSLLLEDFIPIKFETKEINYDSILNTIPMLRIQNESNVDHFYKNIDSLLENYDTLYTNRTKGGIIKYIDETQEE